MPSINFRADDEVVDPKKYLEESCKPKCVRYLRAYEVSHIIDQKKKYDVSHIEHWTCNKNNLITKESPDFNSMNLFAECCK